MAYTRNIVRLVDEYITNNVLTEEDYTSLMLHIRDKLAYYWYKKILSAPEVTNEFLLYLRKQKKQYNTSFKIYQKKRYINYIILKCIQNITKIANNIIDAGNSKIFPYTWTEDKPMELKSLSYRLRDEWDSYEDETAQNNLVVYSIIKNLWRLTDIEYNVFVDIFLLDITQEQCAEWRWLTQQRISQIVKSIKSTIKDSITPVKKVLCI